MVRRGDRPHHALSARPVLPGRAVRHSACAAHTLRRLDGRLVWQAATDLCRYAGRRAPRNLEGTGFIDLPQNPGHAETPAALAGWRDIRPLLRRMISAEWPKSNLERIPVGEIWHFRYQVSCMSTKSGVGSKKRPVRDDGWRLPMTCGCRWSRCCHRGPSTSW